MRHIKRAMLALILIIAGVYLWNVLAGKTERVRYLGVDQGRFSEAGAALKTEPHSNWRMIRGPELYGLKQECVYDFNYNPGIDPRHDPNREKWVRSAKLIACRG